MQQVISLSTCLSCKRAHYVLNFVLIGKGDVEFTNRSLLQFLSGRKRVSNNVTILSPVHNVCSLRCKICWRQKPSSSGWSDTCSVMWTSLHLQSTPPQDESIFDTEVDPEWDEEMAKRRRRSNSYEDTIKNMDPDLVRELGLIEGEGKVCSLLIQSNVLISSIISHKF